MTEKLRDGDTIEMKFALTKVFSWKEDNIASKGLVNAVISLTDVAVHKVI